MKYQNEIIEIIKAAVDVTEPIENMEAETNLQNAGMDSISLIGVVIKIENRFGIKVPIEKLLAYQFVTIKALCQTVTEVTGE